MIERRGNPMLLMAEADKVINISKTIPRGSKMQDFFRGDGLVESIKTTTP
jgi:hypothetical protein